MLDIELDDEIIKETQVDSDKRSKDRRKLTQFKQELDRELKKMIYPKFMSRKYLEPKNVDKILSINSNFLLNIF